jgi:hypothetical protein
MGTDCELRKYQKIDSTYFINKDILSPEYYDFAISVKKFSILFIEKLKKCRPHSTRLSVKIYFPMDFIS